MPRAFDRLPQRLFLTLMLAGSALITAASVPYFDFRALPAFVVEKLPLRFEALWLFSLRAHVASASLAFPLCLVSMSRSLQRRPIWHRRLGRIAGIVVLFALLPSGIVLAFDAKGGKLVTAGFLLSAAIVGGSMLLGVKAARRRDFVVHRRAMRHVVAQMTVAVSSRALIIGLDAVGIDPSSSYVIALWGPVLVSAVIAELLSRRAPSRASSLATSEERIRREAPPFAAVLRLRALIRPLPRLGR